ncbi:hypothetical protein P389DRAFT_208424 [Cystobasidium minutum MCA 4210]|uniref:uncharacterized protein n=1 Tax=Cystobasidium minutum MCA 4210 TaxID=1397322 RepID=UPI0034CEA60C|eukprot:jgi/Rhomi1/208424/estExt_Genemark1.C_2_t10088
MSSQINTALAASSRTRSTTGSKISTPVQQSPARNSHSSPSRSRTVSRSRSSSGNRSGRRDPRTSQGEHSNLDEPRGRQHNTGVAPDRRARSPSTDMFRKHHELLRQKVGYLFASPNSILTWVPSNKVTLLEPFQFEGSTADVPPYILAYGNDKVLEIRILLFDGASASLAELAVWKLTYGWNCRPRRIGPSWKTTIGQLADQTNEYVRFGREHRKQARSVGWSPPDLDVAVTPTPDVNGCELTIHDKLSKELVAGFQSHLTLLQQIDVDCLPDTAPAQTQMTLYHRR